MHALTKLFGVACLFGMASMGMAQEKSSPRRLESVTWNPTEHRLTWTVAEGKGEAAGKTTYEIDMDAATMTLNGEGRRFSRQEAVQVQQLMNLVARYAAESTLWWEAGKGEPLDGSKAPKADSSPDDERTVTPRARPHAEEPARGTRILRISDQR